MTGAEYDPDALALASMVADSLRGIPIRVDELPPSAWRLVAGYVAAHDYGDLHGADPARTGALFMGAPVRARFRARGPDGRELPRLPKIRRGEPVVIDADDPAATRPAIEAPEEGP